MQEIENNGQIISSCGVGAHHQNAHAERAIRTVLTTARALMLHAILRWPQHTKTDYWPMATQHASYLNNILPLQSCGFSPMEILSGNITDHKTLRNLPVWGCPAYVLHPILQSKGKLPRWQPRSRRAQFMGWSATHASNVALVRNLNTGFISPQYHIVLDNWFKTVHVEENENEIDPEWDLKFTRNINFDGQHHEIPLDDEDRESFELDDDWLTKEERLEKQSRMETKIHPNYHKTSSHNNRNPVNDTALNVDEILKKIYQG